MIDKDKLAEYIGDRIDDMIVAKLDYFRREAKDLFKNRHNTDYPELTKKVLAKTIRDIRVWEEIEKRIRS